MPDNEAYKLRKWVADCFPQLMERVPLCPFHLKFGNTEMFATHDIPELSKWIYSEGFPRFIRHPALPDGFFAYGISSRAVAEYLLAMWKKDGRYYWFYDRYVLYIIKDDPSSIARTRENLDKTLRLWDEGKTYVILIMSQSYDWDPEIWKYY
jgi:hypothetical protein